ncbi:MAG: efflux RND transporter periplasmic adaptor subunit [Ignavibacteriaceae bacterium]|nr:efflux RND transporter periplasmic adaptor subunit [Ignavibacteriaceae bacterium]
MNKKVKIVVNLIVLSLAACLIVGCQSKTEDKSEVKDILELDTIAVQAEDVQYRNIISVKNYTGTIEGEEQAYIVSKISERIVSVNAKVGDYIEKGKLLVELDKVGATSQYYQAEAGYQNAKKEFERMQALYSEGAISQQMLDGTHTAFNIAKANFEAAKGLVELTAPISGIIAELKAEVGDLTMPGMRIITIAKINRVKAIFNVGEQDIMSLKVGQPIEVFSELKPELVMKGSITQISKSADIDSRTFEVKGIIGNTSEKWFKPGMFCKVKINFAGQKGSLIIPSVAIVTNGNDKGVYVIQGGKAAFKKITTGITDDIYTEIVSGLNEKDKVITVGINNLKDGISIRLVN